MSIPRTDHETNARFGRLGLSFATDAKDAAGSPTPDSLFAATINRRLWTDVEVSVEMRRFGISISAATLKNWRSRKKNWVRAGRDDGPPYFRIGAQILYDQVDVAEWIQSRKIR